MKGRRGGAAALIAALLVVGGLGTIQPRGLGNAWHSATAPDTADAGDFRVTIGDPAEDVIIARTVSHGYKSYTTDHRLVLARVRYEFVRTDATINDVRLVSRDGYVYESLSDYDVTHTRLQPGFQSEGIVVFEAPDDQLDGASFEFCRTAIVQDRFDCARLDGVITADTVRHDDATVTLDPSELTYEVIGR